MVAVCVGDVRSRVAYLHYAPYNSHMTSTTAPAFTHTPTCDTMALGAAAQALIAIGMTHIPVTALEGYAEGWQRGEIIRHCTCGKDALRKVESDLTLARKRERAYRNSPAFGSAEYSGIAREVESLIAQRAAIRESLA